MNDEQHDLEERPDDEGVKPPEAVDTAAPVSDQEIADEAPEADAATDAMLPAPVAAPEPEPPQEDPPSSHATAEQASNLSQRMDEMAALLERIARQQELLPQQMRRIGRQVEEVATSVSESRLRDLLKSVLILYDLVGQMHAQTPGDDQPHYSNYAALTVQIRQMLDQNGLLIIDGTGPFDPSMHRPVKAVACGSPEESGQILELVRPGFRTEHSVLRYAEIVLSRYDGAPPTPEDPAEPVEMDPTADDASQNTEDAR